MIEEMKKEEEKAKKNEPSRPEQIRNRLVGKKSLELSIDLETFPVTLSQTVDGKKVKTKYYLRELTGEEGDDYMKFKIDKSVASDKEGIDYLDPKDSQAMLISLCLHHADGNNKVGIEEVRKFPDNVLEVLMCKAEELCGMIPLEELKNSTGEPPVTGS